MVDPREAVVEPDRPQLGNALHEADHPREGFGIDVFQHDLGGVERGCVGDVDQQLGRPLVAPPTDDDDARTHGSLLNAEARET